MNGLLIGLLSGLPLAATARSDAPLPPPLPHPGQGRIECIERFESKQVVVGIWNSGPQRYEKMLAPAPAAARRGYIEQAQNGQPRADACLPFIVEDLKPAIDRRDRTRRGPGAPTSSAPAWAA